MGVVRGVMVRWVHSLDSNTHNYCVNSIVYTSAYSNLC